jgi:NADH:ubiquinone oxidoreductase subunit 2 (subunit N)
MIELKGLFKTNPYLTFAFTISLFSLAGIPPLAGFIEKLFLLEEYLNYHSLMIFFIIIISSIIAIYNYIKPLLLINFYKMNLIKINITEIEAFIITIITLMIIS